ncbi:MBL fold metallo-hydrolase [Burkholderia sp. Ac-20353]|nr:MBL fold metallo-hydrolase [Burkholderia sp. Ac-20353]MBN3788209.1 MBL fold metallo-hydrolase [Burkholderia sp. Ac-20353]
MAAPAFATPATPATPFAAPEPQSTVLQQLPGVYRFALGDARITALSDGSVDLDLHKLLRGANRARIDALLRHAYLQNPVRTSINVFLIESGGRRILVDTGSGTLFGGPSGRLIESLAAAGIGPDQIDDILLTHVHIDHIGGLASDGKPVFPNATVHVGQPDVEFYLSAPAPSHAHADAKASAIAARMLQPYADQGKLKPFSGSEEILPEIVGAVHPGHTPGSAIYTLESRGQKIRFIGDAIHSLVQFADPSITVAFDTDSGLAEGVREDAFAQAASTREWIAAPHLPFPGIGHIRRADAGYDWVPVSYEDRPLALLPAQK